MGLDWEGGVARLASVANDRPDNEPLHQDEDDGGEGEDEIVEGTNLNCLLCYGRSREGRLTAGRNEGDGGQAQQH